MSYKDLIEKDKRSRDLLLTECDDDKGIINEMLAQVKREAFMEGYRYAIKVLEDSIVDKEKAK